MNSPAVLEFGGVSRRGNVYSSLTSPTGFAVYIVPLTRSETSLSGPRKEAELKDQHMTDVCSTVGNLIRIAAVVELNEVAEACESAEAKPLEIQLLDPREAPASPVDHLRNRQLLEAFAQFRWHIEMIRRSV